MTTKQLGNIITKLGKALVENSVLFEQEAKSASLQISNSDLSYLQSIFHNPPPIPLEIDEKSLGLGNGWQHASMYVLN